MRILLVSPSEGSFVNYSKAKRTVCVGLPQLVAYTPAEHEVRIVHHGPGDIVPMSDLQRTEWKAMCSAGKRGRVQPCAATKPATIAPSSDPDDGTRDAARPGQP